MKALFLSIAILFTIQINAQNSFKNIKEESILINGQQINVVNSLLKGDLKQVQKSWLSFIKEHLQQKMSEKDNVLYANEIVINQVTDKRGDLLTYLYNKDNEVSINIAFKLGYDISLNSNQYATEFSKFKDFLDLFINNYYKDFLPNYINSQNKSLSILEKEKSKSEKSNKKSKSTITKHNRKIKKNNKNIEKFDAKVQRFVTDSLKSKQFSEKKVLLKNKNEEFQKTIDYQNGLIKVNEEIISTLSPKIDIITKEINSANLTLIEVRSKIKVN